jgi:hypothetical protein
VQKQRQVEPDGVQGQGTYNDPRKAVEVALNVKFSLIAIGTFGYTIPSSLKDTPTADLMLQGLGGRRELPISRGYYAQSSRAIYTQSSQF